MNTAELWYESTGTGPPLVLTGGFGLLHDQFARITPLLADRFTVINWHYRGSGKSSREWPQGGFALDDWVDDMETVRGHLGHDRIHLWGTSTGAYLSIRYAARFPEHCERLITYPSFKAGPSAHEVFETFRMVGETLGYEALAKVTQWIGAAEHHVYSQEGHDFVQWERDCFARNFDMNRFGDILDVFVGLDLTGDVKALQMPILLLMGGSGIMGASGSRIAEAAESFRALAPQAETAIIPDGGGTYCMIEEPEATAPVVMDFLTRA